MAMRDMTCAMFSPTMDAVTRHVAVDPGKQKNTQKPASRLLTCTQPITGQHPETDLYPCKGVQVRPAVLTCTRFEYRSK